MKCDTCKNCLFHPAGSFYAVAEGGDDPYSYWYCCRGRWSDGYEPEMDAEDCDPWINCTNYIEE